MKIILESTFSRNIFRAISSFLLFKIYIFMKGVNYMNKLTSFVSKTFTKAKVKTIKHGPAIAITVGLIGMAGSVYLTYKAATKIEEAKKLREENLKEVENAKQNGCITAENGIVDVYSEEDADRDAKIYNSRFIVSCVKYGAPALGLFILSAFFIFKGFRKEAARLTAAGATIAGLTTQLKDIKEELENAVGKEKANDIFLGKNTHTETEINPDTGEINSKEVTTTNRFVSGYTFEFSKESSPLLYSGHYSMDKSLIEGNLRRANWLMDEKQGHVLFNDILDSFEVKRVGYGGTDGSVETPGHTIIFDIDEREDENGNTYFIITPNLQGYIADKI